MLPMQFHSLTMEGTRRHGEKPFVVSQFEMARRMLLLEKNLLQFHRLTMEGTRRHGEKPFAVSPLACRMARRMILLEKKPFAVSVKRNVKY